MREIETRNFPATVEVRAKEGSPVKTLRGMAAVYGKRSEDLGGFVEEIEAGAFDASLESGRNVMARAEHDSRMLLGTTEAGTLSLRSTKEGLEYEVDLPDTSAGRDVGVLVGRGDVSKSSFAFYTVRDRWEDTKEGLVLRTVLEAELIDVAPVAMPAYSQTSVSARSRDMASATREVADLARTGARPSRELTERVRRLMAGDGTLPVLVVAYDAGLDRLRMETA